MSTEDANAKTTQLDQLSTLDIVRIINEEDGKVALAVQRGAAADRPSG